METQKVSIAVDCLYDELETFMWYSWECDQHEGEARRVGPSLLVKVRGELGLTQQELADSLGVTRFHLCKMERGKEPTTLSTIASLSGVYRDEQDPS